MNQRIKQMKGISARLSNRRVFYSIFLAVIAGFFILFFTSRLWLPASGTITETPVGTKYQIGVSSYLQLKSQALAADGSLIVDLGIADLNISSEKTYSIGATDASNKRIDLEILYSDSSFVIVRIPSAEKSKAVLVNVQVQEQRFDKDTPEKAKVYSFAFLTESLKTDTSLPADFSSEMCILYDMQVDLGLLKSEEVQYQIRLQQNLAVISNAEKKIADIQSSQQFMTAEEQAASARQIEQLQNAIISTQKEITTLSDNLLLVQSNIAAKEQKIEEYQTEIT